METKKTFVFDLDGTICSQTMGGDDYAHAVPNPLVIDCMKKLWDLGHEIIIYTARGMGWAARDLKHLHREEQLKKVTERYDKMTRQWLDDNDVMYHRLHFGKPAGDYYIDDKGMALGYLIDLLGVA